MWKIDLERRKRQHNHQEGGAGGATVQSGNISALEVVSVGDGVTRY